MCYMGNLGLYTLLGDGALASQCGRCWGLILNISKLNKTSCECKASNFTGMRSHRSEFLFHARHCMWFPQPFVEVILLYKSGN